MSGKMTMPEPGQYKIGISDAELKKRLLGAEVSAVLDAPAKATVIFSCDPEYLGKLDPSSFQEKLEIEIKGTPVFRGTLTGFQQTGGNRLHLIYQDMLYSLRKTFDHSFVKSNTLGRVVDTVCGIVGCCTDQKGDFSQQIPSFSLEGKPLFDHLVELATRFGFFFGADPKEQKVQLIRAGKNTDDQGIDLSKEPHQIDLLATTDQIFESLKVKFFNSKDLTAQEKQLGASQIYSEIGSYQDSASYQARKSWKAAKGSLGLHWSDQDHYDGAEKLLPFQLSKMGLQQETVRLTCFNSDVKPGQSVKLSAPVAKQLAAGKFFVLGCHYEFSSAIAKTTITGVRA